jgi:hypothetical protein
MQDLWPVAHLLLELACLLNTLLLLAPATASTAVSCSMAAVEAEFQHKLPLLTALLGSATWLCCHLA